MPQARTEAVASAVPNDLESFWIPFTPNRAFKKAPRLIARRAGSPRSRRASSTTPSSAIPAPRRSIPR